MIQAPFDTETAVRALRDRLADDVSAFAVVVVGPSGVGKTTLCRNVLAQEPEVRRLATTTTRRPRDEETEGVERHFLSEAEFRVQLAAGAFVEYAEVHGHLYGATLDSVYAALVDGGIMLMDVDVQGMAAWQRILGHRCVTVFVLPPSLAALEARLDTRRSETVSDYQLRMENAMVELRHAAMCDYLITNDVLSDAVADLRAVIRSERNRTVRRRHRLSDLGFAPDVASPSP